MSQVIDWSKYGRSKREKPQVEITYQGNEAGTGTVVTAVFPLEHLDYVIERLRAQRDYWKAEGKNRG